MHLQYSTHDVRATTNMRMDGCIICIWLCASADVSLCQFRSHFPSGAVPSSFFFPKHTHTRKSARCRQAQEDQCSLDASSHCPPNQIMPSSGDHGNLHNNGAFRREMSANGDTLASPPHRNDHTRSLLSWSFLPVSLSVVCLCEAPKPTGSQARPSCQALISCFPSDGRN